MCTIESPNDIRVLYCGDLAPDDFMWSVECSLEQLFAMLDRPQKWVDDLGKLPDWKLSRGEGKTPSPVLTNHFNIQLAQGRADVFSEGKIQIEGISETGIVRVVANAVSLKGATEKLISQITLPPGESLPDDEFEAYWSLLAIILKLGRTQVDVILNPDNGTWFGHLQIYHPDWDGVKGLRAAWIALYVLMRSIDPAGYTGFLTGLGPIVRDLAGNLLTEGTFTISHAPDASFGYSSSEKSEDEACDALFGLLSIVPNSGELQNSTVKNYAPDPPPPHAYQANIARDSDRISSSVAESS